MKLNVRRHEKLLGGFFSNLSTLILLIYLAFFIGVTLIKERFYTSSIILWLLGGVVLVIIANSFWNYYLSRLLSKRKERLFRAVHERSMRAATLVLSPNLHNVSENSSRFRNRRTEQSYIAEDWGYCEFSFDQYAKTKRGTYNVATYYFAVAGFRLPRKLPNIFFDSGSTGGKEFRVQFRRNQRHSLESIFDNHFTTYFHESYTIDNLSFITPEVMEALVKADNHDIEIYDDMLYLYNELENMPDQLEGMERDGKIIRQKLMNNIETYRDERIDYSKGRKSISILGLSLKRSLRKNYLSAFFGLLILVTTMVGAIYGFARGYYPFNLLVISIFGYVSFWANYRKIKQIRQDEKFREENANIHVNL